MATSFVITRSHIDAPLRTIYSAAATTEIKG
jgi:hypothetical protein